MNDPRRAALISSADDLLRDFQILADHVGDRTKLHELTLRLDRLIRRAFHDDDIELEHWLKEANISFNPTYFPASRESQITTWRNGCAYARNVLSAMREELVYESHGAGGAAGIAAPQNSAPGNRVFVVHGQDETMKQAVARLVTQLGYEPIVLHEQPNRGRTIIEKFEAYSDVQFAIVCLSADDHCLTELRARQNVILELGYFLGALGRAHVVALHDTNPALKLPSDYDGVLWTPFDKAGAWRTAIAREMRAAGLSIDMNKL